MLTSEYTQLSPLVPPLVVPVDSVVVVVQGMSAVLQFVVLNAYPLVSDEDVRWFLIRQGSVTDITNNTMLDNSVLTFGYNMTAQLYTLTISHVQPNFTLQFNIVVSNPAGASTNYATILIEGKFLKYQLYYSGTII